MNKILQDNTLIVFIILGLAIRIILALIPGFKIDVDAWFAWAIRLHEGGLMNFYSEEVWTNYTPGYLYILKILGALKEIFSINDTFFYTLLKIPAIFFDIAIAILVYTILLTKNHKKTAQFAAAAIVFNPALIFNSSIWGQIDSILSFALLLSIYFLSEKKLKLSSVFFAIAFLIKPQAISLLPVFVFFLIQNFSLQKLLNLSFPALISLTLFSIPFFGLQSIQKLLELLLKMMGDYPYSSLFAYNFWGTVGFWIKDNQIWLNITYQYLGYILYFSFWAVIFIWHFFKKNLSLYSLSSLAFLSFYFLPTRVHERYLYPALPFLIILAFQFRSRILSLSTYYLSFIYLINLYYVYIYYNVHFLKLSSDIYFPNLYIFLETYAKQISQISTLIFVLITIILIRSGYDKKITST